MRASKTSVQGHVWVPALQLPANDNTTLRVNAVNLKYRLCDVEADGL
jgi:hypothetical protein